MIEFNRTINANNATHYVTLKLDKKSRKSSHCIHYIVAPKVMEKNSSSRSSFWKGTLFCLAFSPEKCIDLGSRQMLVFRFKADVICKYLRGTENCPVTRRRKKEPWMWASYTDTEKGTIFRLGYTPSKLDRKHEKAWALLTFPICTRRRMQARLLIVATPYLKAIGYFSMSRCASGPARESRIGPRRRRMERNTPAHLLLPYDHCLVHKLKVSFAKEPYTRDYILQKRPINLRSLLIVATP